MSAKKLINVFTLFIRLSWQFFAFYISVIFLFSAIYTVNSKSFYHPYVQFESHFSKEEDKIIKEVEGLIKKTLNIRQRHNPKIIIDPNSVSINSLSRDGDSLLFITNFHVIYKDSDSFEIYLQAPIALNPDSKIIIGTMRDGKRLHLYSHFRPNRYYPWPPKLRLDLLEETWFFEEIESRLSTLFVDNDSTVRNLYNLIQAYKGFPHSIGGKFVRMLYLSVVTITTLGYGDIIPLTSGMRFLIGIECIAGIILLGIFVNYIHRKYDILCKK